MTGWRQVVELAMTDEEIGGLTAIALPKRGDEPSEAGANAARLPSETVVLRGGAGTWSTSPDGATMRRAGAGLWPSGGTLMTDRAR
jgi:hypothetical protein